jgi:hypothetical protein
MCCQCLYQPTTSLEGLHVMLTDTEIGEMSDTGVNWLRTVLQSDWVGYDEELHRI